MPNDLVINPNFWLVPSSSRVGGQVTSVTIMAPVKGRGLQYFFADRDQHAEMFRMVVDIEKALKNPVAKPVEIPKSSGV